MRSAEPRQALFWAAGVAAIYTALFAWTTDLNAHQKWGDDHSTMLSMYAGGVFAERGFVETQYTVRIPSGVGPGTETTYTHFPPLPYYVAGVLWSFGGTSLAAFKLTFFVFALASVLGIYALVREMLGVPIAVCTALAIVFHEIGYLQLCATPLALSDAFVWWALYCLVKALRSSGSARRWFLVIAWCLHWLNCWSSFEYIVSGQLLIAALIVWEKQNLRTWLCWNLLFGLAPILMMVIHGATNAWALGGYQAALEDFGVAFLWRTMDVGRNTEYFAEISGGPRNFPNWLLRQLVNLYGLFPFYSWIVREPLRVAHYTVRYSPEFVIAVMPFLAVLATPIFARFARKPLSDDARRLLRLLIVFCIADLSFLLIFQQLASIHIYRQVGRHWLSTYGLLIGGASYLAWRGTFKVDNAPITRVGMSFLFVLVMTIPVVNAASLLLNGPLHRANTYTTEFETLSRIAKAAPSPAFVLTDDASLWQCAFVHQPAESFDIAAVDIRLGGHDAMLSGIQNGYRDGAAPHLWVDEKQMTRLIAGDHRILSAYARDLSGESRNLYRPTGIWEEARIAEVSPAQTAVSDFTGESASAGPYTPTYGGALEVVARPDAPGANPDSEWCLKIQSAGASKSGLQNRTAGKITIAADTTYEITWSVLCDASAPEFKAGLASSSGIHWSAHPHTSSALFQNQPGEWTTFSGLIHADEVGGEVFIFLHQNEERPLTWYVDDVQIVALPRI